VRPESPRAALAYRDFRLYLASTIVASIATQMQSVAVGWQVLDLTGRAIDLGYVGLAQFFPMLLLSPFAGDVADRFDRMKIVVVCEAVLAATSVALFAVSRGSHVQPEVIYLVLAVFGIARAFSGPADQALLTHVVPTEHFPNAVAWTSSAWQVATIAGPALGGVIYAATHHATTVYAISALLHIASFAFLALMRTRTGRLERGTAHPIERLVAGIQYVRRHPVILGAISLDLFAVLFGGAVALLPIFARDILHVNAWGLGILRSAPAVGAALTALFVAYRPIGRRAGIKLFASVTVFGIATIVFACSEHFGLSVAALAIAGAADMVSVVIRRTVIQIETPPELRGRVSAVNQVFVGASNELGEFESGLTATWFGTVPAVLLGGIGTLVVVAAWMLAFPPLRAVDRLVSREK
jgi:MFS family permease